MPTRYVFEKKAQDHDADLYRYARTAEGLPGFDSLDDEAFAHYEREGYLYIRGAFDSETVAAAKQELAAMATADDPQCANVAYEGALREQLQRTLANSSGDGASLDDVDPERMQELVRTIDPQVRASMVRKFMGFTKTHPPLARLAKDEQLRSTIRRIIGDKPKIFQTMALVKPPGGREKPWHQDHAYFNFPVDTKIAGVWIALDHVDAGNGCMMVLSGAHKQGPRIHFRRRDWQICDTEMFGLSFTALPMEPGDLMIFDAKLPHGTPTNRSNRQRWAVQFHFVPASSVQTDDEYRLGIFGPEGKNVSC